MAFAGTECVAHKVCTLESYVEQIAFACGEVMCCRCLVEMSDVVEFVAPVFLSHPAVFSARRRVCGVMSLRAVYRYHLLPAQHHEGDDAVDVVIELQIRMEGKCERRAFENLVDIGVIEVNADERPDFSPALLRNCRSVR